MNKSRKKQSGIIFRGKEEQMFGHERTYHLKKKTKKKVRSSNVVGFE